jgi:hypothetical protein
LILRIVGLEVDDDDGESGPRCRRDVAGMDNGGLTAFGSALLG